MESILFFSRGASTHCRYLLEAPKEMSASSVTLKSSNMPLLGTCWYWQAGDVSKESPFTLCWVFNWCPSHCNKAKIQLPSREIQKDSRILFQTQLWCSARSYCFPSFLPSRLKFPLGTKRCPSDLNQLKSYVYIYGTCTS